MAKKPHYSEKPDTDTDVDDIISRHLAEATKKHNVKRGRTIYLTDKNYHGAYQILGKRINDFVDEALGKLIEAHARLKGGVDE